MLRGGLHAVVLVVAVLTCHRALADLPVPLVAPEGPRPPEEQQRLFRLPPGFEIELIAAEPEIRKPINMAFDAAGRLFVTQSIEYPFPAKEGTPRDTIKLITDTNGDGVPDKVTTFADGLNIPIGVLPLTGGAVLGYSIPSIYRFEDTDGDGKADKREVLYGSFEFVDTHGMASSFNWWLDGWIHACHGFRNNSKVKGADDKPIVMQSGNTYRFRSDGSHIEYYTHGQVNPFGMTFDPLGNVYTADCHSRPLYMLLRGAYYPSFGKPHDGLGFGPEMIFHTHGSTGICGVVYYAADNFPALFHDTVFIGNPVTGRINHDRLEAHGSTYKAIEQADFVSCDDLWFRPVDIKLAPDGSMYVADFYNCMIGHYEVDLHHPRRDRERGRIWRITYKGPAGRQHSQAPDLAKAGADELIGALDHPNMVVRTLAVHQLAERVGKPAAARLRQALAHGGPQQRVGALWVLMRLRELTSADVEALARDADRMVRVHLAKALAAFSSPAWERGGRTAAAAMLNDADAFVRRAAADTLGQHPDPANVSPLLDLWRKTPAEDTHLVHVARISLRDNLAAHPDLPGLAAKYRDETDSLRRIAEASLGIASPAAGEFLLAYLESPAIDPGRVPEFLEHAARHIPDESLSKLFAHAVSLRAGSDEGRQVSILRGLNRAVQSRGKQVAPDVRTWEVDLTGKLLDHKDERSLRTGIDLAREFQVKDAAATLEALAGPDSRLPAVRQPAIEALVPLDAPRAIPLLSRFVETGTEPLPARQHCADLLGGINSAESRAESLRLLKIVPDQVALVITRGLAGSKAGAEALVAAAVEGKASARLLSDAIVAERLKSAKLPELLERVETLLKDLPSEDERSRQLLAARQAGFGKAKTDLAKGAEIFTKTCAACHRVDGKGGKVGPDLDGIGNRGLERLLEDVLAPNRNVDGAFRSSTIVRQDGGIVTGLIVREEGEIVVVVNDQGKEVRVAKRDIDEKKTMNLSPMPANISEQLSEPDFFHLLAYLLSLKAQPTAGAK